MTQQEAAEKYAEPYRCPATNENEYCKHDIISAFNNGANWKKIEMEFFAIGLADWIRVCKLKGRPYDFDNIKELLEIYKDEKGL